MEGGSSSADAPSEQVTDWQPFQVQRCIAASSRNFVGLMEDGCSVLKYPRVKTKNAMEDLYEEAARYKHLGPHDSLVSFKGLHEDGLIFEYCHNGNLEDLIRDEPCLSERAKWKMARQIILGLMHLHDHRLIHCDLTVYNIFITSALDAKIGDIQGQLYRPDGSVELPTMSQETAKSRHPLAGEDEFTARTDIFALGTVLYHLWYGHSPFPDLNAYDDEEEIQARYRSGGYPIDLSIATNIDTIIYNCWTSGYASTREVFHFIECAEGLTDHRKGSTSIDASTVAGA